MDETGSERTWEAETLDLIRRLEEDRLKKAEQRLAAAQRAVSSVRAQIDALHLALDVYRNEHGLARAEIEPPDAEQAAEYQGMSVKEMLYHWADQHGGRVVMKDATKFLAAAGLFRDETQAAGALYPAIGRADDDFEKVGRGVYQRRPRITGESFDAPAPTRQSGDDPAFTIMPTETAVHCQDAGPIVWPGISRNQEASGVAAYGT